MEVLATRFFLNEFYAVVDAYVEWDDPTTTFASCGAILLAAVLAETRSVDVLTEITGFPIGFVEGVLRVMEIEGYYLSLQFADLITAVHLYREDMKKLGNTIDAFMESYWSRMDPVWCGTFELLRGGYLFGGRPQWWIDAGVGL